jgi:diguanylate cyclase (GGDEF)-like protein
MLKAIRVLFVDDSEDDVILLRRHLKKAQYHCHYHRVDTQDSLVESLASDEWDLVISDHTMPTLDSTQVLEIVKSINPELPVIIVSGEIGEDLAIESMAIGADDYVMKDNLKRLIPVIEREISGAHHRRARQRAESQLRHMAFNDPLTNLPNRHEFNRICQSSWRDSKTNKTIHTLVYLDLDQFKVINDTCGHIAGDELLMQLAVVLKSKVSSNGLLARLGGDEFGILLENCDLEQCIILLEKIKDAVNEFRFSWKEKVFNVGVSFGVAVIDDSVTSVAIALANADMACYAAKEKGRNRIEVYQSDNTEMLSRKSEMEWLSEIRKALEENRFVLMRQIIVPAQDDNQLAHYEMLVRMKKADGNLIYPGAFIPAAERFNIMQEIDRWVINRTIEHIKSQDESSKEMYFVNLSGNSLSDDHFLNAVEAKLIKQQVNCNRLCFEVTETAAIANLNKTIIFIERLRKLNCSFALDDFGCGLSSFSYLKEIPLDFLKIDGSFVRNILDDELDEAIVRASHHISKAAKLKTIAEFVENEEICQRMKEIGVDFVQGWALGKPELLPS